MIVMASHMQEQEVGDGTNFVLVFAGALLELAEELLRMGLSVSEVSTCSMHSCKLIKWLFAFFVFIFLLEASNKLEILGYCGLF